MLKRLLPALLIAALGSPAFVSAASAAGFLTEQLGAAGPLSGADIMPIVQGSSPAKRTTVGSIGDFLAGRAETLTAKTIDCTSGNTCILPATSGGPTTPGTTTPGFVPLWGDAVGGSLEVGLPVATSGNSTIVETDATGHIMASLLPFPTLTAPGGVEAFAAPANEVLTGINTDGTLAAAQLGFGNLSGQATFAQLPTMAALRLMGTTVAGAPGQIALPSAPCNGANQAANWSGTAFGCATIAGGGGGTPGGTSGQVQINNSGAFGGLTIGGDATLDTTTGNLIVTKSNGTVFAPVATSGSASDLSAGNLPIARGPSMPNNTVLANISGTTGAPQAITQAQATALCNTFTSTLSGCVPASSGGTTHFLRADGTWVSPPTSSGAAEPINMIDATTQAGSDMCAQIATAAGTLDASLTSPNGGIIDARGFSGTLTCHGSMFAGWPSNRGYQVLLGTVKILTDVPQCVPNYDSMIGATEYPNFASSAGTIIEASNNYAADSGHTATISGSSGSFTITVGTANMNVGDYVSGTGIAAHAKVQAISGTTLTLTMKNTGTVSGTGTFMPALVCMGTNPTVQTFHIHVQNIAASCVPPNGTMPTGCVDFQDLWSQEGSYFRNTYAGVAQEQYDLEFLTSVNPQNISPWVDLFAQQLVSTPNLDLVNAVCMNIGNAGNLLEVSSTIDKLSCAAGSTTSALVLVDAAGVTIKDSHFENAIDGILIGSRKFSHGVTLESDSCGTGISSTCAEISAANGADGINIFGLQTSGVTPNIVKDDLTGGCTLTETNVGSFAAVSYIRGGSTGTAPVLKGLWNGC